MIEPGGDLFGQLRNIKRIRLYSYSLPFKEPLSVGRKHLDTRDGWVIQLTDTEGRSGYGEVAPLPGYSSETPKDVETQLYRFLEHKEPGDDWLPSVAFGIETALYFLNHSPSLDRWAGIPVNALLHPEPSLLKEQLETILSAGFKTIKMKVGRQAIGEDIDMVNQVTEMMPDGVRLRLDVNRLWNYDRALIFGHAIDVSAIEYIEEPFADISLIPKFYHELGIPCALDESLPALNIRSPQIPEGVCVFVLKPAMLGGLVKTSAFIRLAQSRGIETIISSCFEAGPGFAVLLELATSTGKQQKACGLDTLKYLERHLLTCSVFIRDGVLSCQPVGNHADLDLFERRNMMLVKEQVYP